MAGLSSRKVKKMNMGIELNKSQKEIFYRGDYDEYYDED